MNLKEQNKALNRSLILAIFGLVAFGAMVYFKVRHDTELENTRIHNRIESAKKAMIGVDANFYTMLSQNADSHIVLTCKVNADKSDFKIVGTNDVADRRGVKTGKSVFSYVPSHVKGLHADKIPNYHEESKFLQVKMMDEQETTWTDESGSRPVRVRVFDTPAGVIQVHVWDL